MLTQTEEWSWLGIMIVVVFLLVLLLSWMLWKLRPFIEKLRYINMEIGRGNARERDYWRCRRRQLWFALLNPFARI